MGVPVGPELDVIKAMRAYSKTVIENFLRMSPQVPSYGAKNQHFLIAGADPLYYLLAQGTQEQQAGPLAAAPDLTEIPPVGVTNVEGNIVDIIASTEGTFSAYCITDTTRVYGLNKAGYHDLGYPSGSSVNNVGGRLACSGGFLLATYSSSNKVWLLALPGPGSWSSVSSGTLSTNVGPHLLEPFAEYVCVSDNTVSGNTANEIRLITLASSTILTTPALNLGTGWGIMQMKNYTNKYLAAAIGQVASGGIVQGHQQNYLVLWDAAFNTFNQSIPIPGKFLDMKVIDSVLYVAVQLNDSRTAVYYLSNITLKKLFTTQVSNISAATYAPVNCALFSYNNFVGVKLVDTNAANGSLICPLLTSGSSESGPLEYIFGYGRTIDQLCVGYDGTLFTTMYVPSGNSRLFYKPDVPGTYLSIYYISQWIPVSNLAGLDIYYDEPPVLTGDKISVTIYGKGEDISANGGNSTTPLNDITSTSAMTKKRTQLDVKGFTGDFLRVVLTTTVTGGSTWKPIIRGITPLSSDE